jgi:GT2 family glycosyltransferase
VVRKERKGSVASLNHGGVLIETPWFLVLDDDIYIEADCVEAMVQPLSSQEFDASRVGAIAGYPLLAGRQWTLRALVRLWVERFFLLNGYRELCLLPSTYFTICECGWNPGKPYPVDFVPGGLALWRTVAFKELLYDTWFIEEYAHAADLELSIRLKKDWEIIGVPAARGLHGKSPRSRTPKASLGRMKIRNQRHIFLKHFSGSPIRWICFYWAVLGQIVLMTMAALTALNHRRERWAEVGGMVGALFERMPQGGPS